MLLAGVSGDRVSIGKMSPDSAAIVQICHPWTLSWRGRQSPIYNYTRADGAPASVLSSEPIVLQAGYIFYLYMIIRYEEIFIEWTIFGDWFYKAPALEAEFYSQTFLIKV